MIKFINRLSMIIILIVLFLFLDAHFFNIWLDPTFTERYGSSVAVFGCIVLLIYVTTYMQNSYAEKSTLEDEELEDTEEVSKTIVVRRYFYYVDGDQKFVISDDEGLSVFNLTTSKYIGYMKDGKLHFGYRKNGKNITKNAEKLLLKLKEREGENNENNEK